MKTVCFTGHRAISNEILVQLTPLLDKVIEEQIAEGAVEFRTGGALGFDTFAALAVLKAKAVHPEIRLSLILPCPSQPDAWSSNDRALYRQISECADTVQYVSPYYYNGVLQLRNRRLVEGADVCVAYLTTSHGGTAFTVSQAILGGAAFINLAERIQSA